MADFPARSDQFSAALDQQRRAEDYNSEDILHLVLASLDDDKAENIVQIDIRGRSDVADYMVICSGRSSRQVSAVSQKLADRLKQSLGILSKVEGKETGDWVLIDCGDVIVHVFRPEVRDFYQLEKLWLSEQNFAVFSASQKGEAKEGAVKESDLLRDTGD